MLILILCELYIRKNLLLPITFYWLFYCEKPIILHPDFFLVWCKIFYRSSLYNLVFHSIQLWEEGTWRVACPLYGISLYWWLTFNSPLHIGRSSLWLVPITQHYKQTRSVFTIFSKTTWWPLFFSWIYVVGELSLVRIDRLVLE